MLPLFCVRPAPCSAASTQLHFLASSYTGPSTTSTHPCFVREFDGHGMFSVHFSGSTHYYIVFTAFVTCVTFITYLQV